MTKMLRTLGAPPTLMVVTWLCLVLLHQFGPIDYFRVPTTATWGAIAVGMLLFSLSALLPSALPVRPTPEISQSRIDLVIMLSGAVGLGGILLVIIDKVSLSGLDYSQGLTAIRYLRDEQVGVGIEINRSVLLYIGYLTFSATYAATILYVLTAESAGRMARIVGQLSVVSPIGYALLYGGRAPILLLCALIASAAIVRGMAGRSILPPRLRIAIIGLFVVFLAYVNVTWQDRREFSRTSDYESFLGVAAQSWELQPAPWLDAAVRRGEADADTAMNSVSILLYITHSVGSLDKIVEHRETFTPFLGVYQIGILSPLLRIFLPESGHLARMHQELVDAGLFGWFVSAWGAFFLDFGLWGAIGAVVFWGLAAGQSYRVFAASREIGSALMLTFWLGSVILSPLNSPIGMANSVLILGAFLVAIPLLRRPMPRVFRHLIAPTSSC